MSGHLIFDAPVPPELCLQLGEMMTLPLHCRLVLSGELPFLTLCDFVVWLPFGIHSRVADVWGGMIFLVLYVGFLRSRLSIVLSNKVVELFRFGLTFCFPITGCDSSYRDICVGICLALV